MTLKDRIFERTGGGPSADIPMEEVIHTLMNMSENFGVRGKLSVKHTKIERETGAARLTYWDNLSLKEMIPKLIGYMIEVKDKEGLEFVARYTHGDLLDPNTEFIDFVIGNKNEVLKEGCIVYKDE